MSSKNKFKSDGYDRNAKKVFSSNSVATQRLGRKLRNYNRNNPGKLTSISKKSSLPSVENKRERAQRRAWRNVYLDY